MANFFERIVQFIKKMLSDDGCVSSTRFRFLFTMLISNFIVFGTWLYISIFSIPLKMSDIPWNVIILYGLANGIVSYEKKVSKQQETMLDIEMLKNKSVDVTNENK